MTHSLPSFARFGLRTISLLMLLLLGAGLLAQAQAVRYVKSMATGNGSGSSWANASGNLQAIINASAANDQVWVAAGTYKPTTTTDRTISFAMKNGVSMYGGFAGSETTLSARPAITLTTPSATTLSGDIGAVGDPDDNSFHVILNRLGVTNITMLDGFVITGGNANQSGPVQEPRNLGGGMCNVGQSSFANPSSGPASSPQISNSLFVANSATSGGAIYNGAGSSGVSSPTLTNCVFRANTATSGGAMYNVGVYGAAIQPKLTNCLFQANSATTSGGAIYNDGSFYRTSYPELTNCSFQNNSAATGGAIYNDGKNSEGNCSPTLTNCSFKSNRATDQGGAIYNDGTGDGNSSPLIRNCSFQTNSAGNSGGAIYNETEDNDNNPAGSSPKLTNCLFQTNTAPSGGAIYNFTRYAGVINLVLTNCTFQANRATTGGVLFGYGYGNNYVSTSTLTNCVLFDNGGASTFYNDFTTISATYSLFDASVAGYSGSTGNRIATVSPFASTSDPALFACSPAVNAGLNSATGLVGVTTDLAGNARIFGDRIDMGAYEYQAAGGLTITAPSVSTATTGIAFSQPFTASGGSGPYRYSLASGSLPTGLNLAANGTLSGTPSQVGSFSITVKATNATSCSGVSAPYVLRVTSATPIRYVRAGATGSGNSWADASGDLQSQINVTGAQQVWVAQGTYKPGGNANTDRTISFAMKDGVAIYGGFAGSETSLSQRPAVNLTTPSSTTLSGDIDNSPADNGGNSCHVIRNPPGLTTSAVLDGFVITGGNAYYGDYILRGGGMFNFGDSPTVRNCSFQGNSADVNGGAIFNDGSSSPVLTNCSFQANSAYEQGGAIFNDGSSSPVLTNCSFQANSASEQGGAIFNDGSSSPTFTNCSLLNNSASQFGGAIFNRRSNSTLTNCSLQSNNAPNGGAIANVIGSNSTLINCSLQSNSASQDGGAIYNDGSRANLTNCVVWGNGKASTFNRQQGALITTSYSLLDAEVINFTDAGNNLTTTVSPFVSPTDARLNGCSPAINTGNNAVNNSTTDLAGNPRIANTTIDMGAYEFQGQPNFLTAITQQPPSGSLVCQGSTVSIPLSVSGTGAFTYQLVTANGTPVGPSQSTTPLTLANVQPAQSGSYSVIVTGSCNSVTSTAFSLTVTATPVATLTASSSGILSCAQTSLTLTAGGSTSSVFSGPGIVSQSGNMAVVNASGLYSVTVTNAGCTSTTSITISQDVTPPTATLSASPSATLTCAQTSLTLTAGGGNAYAFSGPGVVNQGGNIAVVNAAGLYSVTVTNTATGCFSTTVTTLTSATAIVRVTNPALTTASLGGAFNQSFTASGEAAGSPDRFYRFSLASGTLPAGLTLSTAGVLSGSATQQGSFPITVSATDPNGCYGTGPVYILTVPVTTLTVLSRDPENGNLYTNTLKPYLLLQNDGTDAIPYGELTVRYYLTLENPQPLRFDINYAQMGNGNVHLNYVPLSPARQGASGYIEFSFDGSAGSLAPMGNAVIQDLINKQDYSMFFQGDDYSYVNNANFAANPHITAYRNGVLVYGVEPLPTGPPAPLGLTLTANPTMLLTTGNTTLTASVSGGTAGSPDRPYSYAFSGPGMIAPTGNTASVSNLPVGVQTFTAVVSDATSPVSQTASATVSVTVTAPVNQPPVATANANQTATQGMPFSYTANAFTDDTPNSLTYSASVNPANGLTFNPATRLIQGTPTNTGVSSVTITATDPGGLSASTVFTITVNAQPVAPTALTLTASANPTTILTTASTQLQANVSGGTPGYIYTFSGPGTIQTNNNTATVSNLPAGVQTFTVTARDATSPVNQTIATTVSVTVTAPANQAPVATANASQTATQGMPFSYTVNAFTDETPNSLTYTASINPANGFTFNPATRVIQGTPQNTGVSSVTITATDPGGLSASTIFTITVNASAVAPATNLTVYSRDPDNGQLNTNTLKPYLQFQNDGNTAIPYGELTVRYWLTVENPAPFRFEINYAQLGSDKVHLNYVMLPQPRQGATGYIEFSFDAAAGSLAANSHSGPIQDLVNKQDYSYFNQGDDYSYVNTPNFAANPRITAYRNGALIYGTEPSVGTRMAADGADARWTVQVLGNPVEGVLVVEIMGAGGEQLHLSLVDESGHVVSRRPVVPTTGGHREVFDVSGQGAGLLLLRVESARHQQTLKVLKR